MIDPISSPPPFQHAQMFQLEVGLPFVRLLQRPAAVRKLPVLDNADGVGQARIARRLNGLEIVERAENVVVPPRRESEAKEPWLDDGSRAMGAKQPVHE